MTKVTPEQLVAKYQTLRVQSNESILAELDTINWSSLRHAHGEASDVPALLTATLSKEENDREFAFILLHETIWHQGTVYEASAYVVPFLFKMLQSSETPDKSSVALLLASLADGTSYLEVHAFLNEENEKTWRKILAKDGRDLETELAQELSWVRATREAVGKNLELLYGYIEHQEPTVREMIVKALVHYPESANDILPCLENALTNENNPYVKAEIELAIEKLQKAILL